MAAITFRTLDEGRYYKRIGAAQADTGQTDWFRTPRDADYCFVFLNITATAGSSPILTPSFLAADPISQDDGHTVLLHAALTANDGTAAQYIYQLGPGVTGIADDVTQAANADSAVSINTVLPPVLGVQLVLDRTSANETYTYNLSVWFNTRR